MLNEDDPKRRNTKNSKKEQLAAQEEHKQKIRRRILYGLGTAGLLTVPIVGGAVAYYVNLQVEALKPRKIFNGPHYANWSQYTDQYLPPAYVMSCAQDLIEADEYKGFADSGNFIKQSLVDYNSVHVVSLGTPVKVAITQSAFTPKGSGEVAAFFGGRMMEDKKVMVEFKDKATGKSKTVQFIDGDKKEYWVGYNPKFANSSGASKALLLAKEASHVLYMEAMKNLIAPQVLNRFYIEAKGSSLSIPDLLFANAGSKFTEGLLPEAGEYFNNGVVYVDWAGYWHIAPALARMLRQNLLNSQEQYQIGSMVSMVQAAKDAGVLKEFRTGQYTWDAKIGPFSREFQTIMRSIRTAPKAIV